MLDLKPSFSVSAEDIRNLVVHRYAPPGYSYNPEQEREPAGSPGGGQWTSGGGTGGEKPPRYVTPEGRNRIWKAHGKTWDSNIPAENAATREPTELSSSHEKALNLFSRDRFRDINAVLRTGVGGKRDTKDLIQKMDAAFARAAPLKQDIVVYRGGFVDKKTWRHFGERGDQGQFYLQDPGFKATASSEKKARDFLNATLVGSVTKTRLTANKIRVIQEILVPKGTKVIPMMGISSTPREKEVLLSRHARIRVLGVDKKSATLYKISGVVER